MPRYLLIVNFEGRRRRDADGGVEAGGDHRASRLLPVRCTTSSSRSGELVDSKVLTGPDLAKIVTSDGITAPVVTDGPFQEFKEWLAGYQIVDVESEARAIEIAARLSAVPGPDGGRDAAADPGAADDGRRRRRTSPRWRRTCETRGRRRAERAVHDRRGPAARAGAAVLGALARRYGDFDAAEDAVQEALLAAADTGRVRVCRRSREAG